MIEVGIIGKTNVGKSTFFTSATMIEVQMENRPFVTIEPNVGVGYVRTKCPHSELKVNCSPSNSICIDGERFIPVRLIDVPGLIPGAHEGRGLGNRFLDELRRADVLIHVVDASGSSDEEGRPVPPGTYDPVEEVKFVRTEVNQWFFSIVSKDWQKFSRTADLSGKDEVDSLLSKLSGISVSRSELVRALRDTKLSGTKLSQWSEQDLMTFSTTLREISMPTIIAANKSDLPESKRNIERLKSNYQHIIPVSAQSELALRKASKSGLVKYVPGDSDFKVLGKLSPKQEEALRYIKERVMKEHGSTGVQQSLNEAVFGALRMIVVYPVEDEKKFTNKDGNVLPDALLMPEGSNPRDLAAQVHSELAKGFLYAIDARRKVKVGEDYKLKDGDIIKIVSTTSRT
jgi:ribosome-binding ATPase YchF (GTP1/OBG family)